MRAAGTLAQADADNEGQDAAKVDHTRPERVDLEQGAGKRDKT